MREGENEGRRFKRAKTLCQEHSAVLHRVSVLLPEETSCTTVCLSPAAIQHKVFIIETRVSFACGIHGMY